MCSIILPMPIFFSKVAVSKHTSPALVKKKVMECDKALDTRVVKNRKKPYAEIALVENLLRQDLNPIEEAEALQRLMDAYAYQQDQLMEIIGKSKATITKSQKD